MYCNDEPGYLVMNILAEYSPAETAAGGAIAGLMALVPLLLFIYGVISLLVPIFVYRIMRRSTQNYLTLKRIEKLLSTQPQAPLTHIEKHVDHWVKDLTDSDKEESSGVQL
jgi:hypothetical protein